MILIRRISTTALLTLLAALVIASACKSEKDIEPKADKAAETSKDKSAETSKDKSAETSEEKEDEMAEPMDGWERVDPGDLPDSKRGKLARAEQAKGEFGQALISTLTDAIGEGDFANAISVCNTEAPQIAERVSKSQDLKIGRTSFKLRNPENTPPRWAQAYVDGKVDETIVVDGPGESVGYLSPIQTGELCTRCHGPADQIPGQVTAALQEQYPNDQATGFEEGDLRGWFWVRVD